MHLLIDFVSADFHYLKSCHCINLIEFKALESTVQVHFGLLAFDLFSF